MKKVEVLSFVVDTEWDNPDLTENIIERWIKTEEGKFIEKHSLVPLVMRKICQPDTFSDKIEVWATLEEKYETFWRLKFK